MSIGQLTAKSDLLEIVESFPPVVHAFGYGSGVFDQATTTSIRDDEGIVKMLDLIFVVDNAHEWHSVNLKQNAHHYATACQWLGPTFCTNLQRKWGAQVFFVPFVAWDDKRTIKYGVIQKDDLQTDLTLWKYLYLAGRMHKPILNVVQCDQVEEWQHRNLQRALASSLLLLDSSADVSLEQVFETICNLSYAGDIRMRVGGEDPNKVSKLVHSPGQMERFTTLYQPHFDALSRDGVLNWDPLTKRIEWDSTQPNALRSMLPQPLQNTTNLQQALESIVAPAARYQSIKGLVTAGPARSIQYAIAKFAKGALRNIV